MFMVLDGKAGYGKTYLVDDLLKRLPKCNPILLCLTHEALAQLQDSIEGQYTFRTIHSALGITPTTSKKDLEFKIGKLPALWDEFNLAIIDEYSQIDDTILEVLTSIGVKILFLGHKSQHAPIVRNRDKFDKCISPVTLQGWETITLTQPMRCLGALGDFVDSLEERIEDPTKPIGKEFDIAKKPLLDYIRSEEGKKDLLAGTTKAIMWSNTGTDQFNEYLRRTIHGAKARTNKYIEGDKVILTKPYNLLPDLEELSQTGILDNMFNKDIEYCFTNTKATVLSCSVVEIKLNRDFTIPLHKVEVEYLRLDEDTNTLIPMLDTFYEIISAIDKQHLADHLEHKAWGKKTPKERGKAYRERHFIMSCFANIKGFFCATSHRMQGSTIDKVIYMYSDILKNPNAIDGAKCTYVSCSRARKELMVFRGIM